MRLMGILTTLLVLFLAEAASAEVATYPCTVVGSNAFAVVDGELSVAQYSSDSATPSLVVDYDRHRMRIGAGDEMPLLANEQAIVGVLNSISPSGTGDQVFGTFLLTRATGRLTGDVHMVTGGATVAVKIVYQCAMTGGAAP